MTILVAAAIAAILATQGRDTAAVPGGAREVSRVPQSEAHAYFDMLVAHPRHWKSYSLREAEQLRRYARCARCPLDIVYDPGVDAAKVVVTEARSSIRNQVYLPLGTEDGHTYFVVWDAYWTSSFLREHHGFANYKAFQFDSNKSIWLETQMRFGGGKARVPGFESRRHIGIVTARSYNRPGGPEPWAASCANCLPPSTTDRHPLAPARGAFIVYPNRWTRYFWLIEQRASDYDLVSLWVADEQTDPVQIYDRVAVSVRDSNTIDYFRLEFNTSGKVSRAEDRRAASQRDSSAGSREIRVRQGAARERESRRGPLVAYVRNFAVLRDPADLGGLLRRPAAGSGSGVERGR